MTERPWANGISRLLAERRGLKKGLLAEIAGVRPALISAVANSANPPEIPTLQRIADGFTKYDRKHDPHAPAVSLWEFFVSDEQSAVLRERAHKTKTASADEQLLARAAEVFAASLKQARAEQAQAPHHPAVAEPIKRKLGR